MLALCGSANLPQYLGIGSGSGTAVATLGSLVAEVISSRVLWSSRDLSVNQQLTIIFDRDSVTMSGVLLTEFGIGGTITKGANDLWAREAFPSITFDGTNELEVQITFQTF